MVDIPYNFDCVTHINSLEIIRKLITYNFKA